MVFCHCYVVNHVHSAFTMLCTTWVSNEITLPLYLNLLLLVYLLFYLMFMTPFPVMSRMVLHASDVIKHVLCMCCVLHMPRNPAGKKIVSWAPVINGKFPAGMFQSVSTWGSLGGPPCMLPLIFEHAEIGAGVFKRYRVSKPSTRRVTNNRNRSMQGWQPILKRKLRFRTVPDSVPETELGSWSHI